MKAFERITIPDFVFTDGSVGVFDGFDRGCCPTDGKDHPRWLWEMGIFTLEGAYFKIAIDSRKSKLSKSVTFILNGDAYYHPIVGFWTIGSKVNPLNGHLVSCECAQCKNVVDESKVFN